MEFRPLIIVLSTLYLCIDSAKVLFFNGMGEGSHYTAASCVGEALVARGISVTFVISESFIHRSTHLLHRDIFQFEIISTRASTDDFAKRIETIALLALEGPSPRKKYRNMMKYHEFLFEDCEDLFQSETILRMKNDYDLMVYDPSFPCTTLLADYLNVTKVSFSPTALVPGFISSFGNPLNPAYVAVAGLGFPTEMKFVVRMKNVVLTFLSELMFRQVGRAYDDIRERFNIRNDWTKSLLSTDLALAASDPIIDQRIPTMPHVKLVGGITTRRSEPLPKHLEEFIQSSDRHGVIVFSLGSYVTQLPDSFIKTFQRAFEKLQQKVIWQWKGETPPRGLPANVKTMNWLPQNDILGHNKTRLLLYQGGNNGLYEAIYHAVPLLVMPIFADQPGVAQRVVEAEVGLKLDATTVTPEAIIEAVDTIMSNSKYQSNMNRLSAIFRDRPQHPRDRAAFWIEHVLKYGADHIRSPVNNLNFVQLHLIDVYFCLSLITVIIVYIVFRCFGFICKKCSNDKTKSD